MNVQTVSICAMGAGGDGVVQTQARRVHVPFTLPGETASIAQTGTKGRLLALESASPERVTPPCPHFGPQDADNTHACGGCKLQHWADAPYRRWKHGLVVKALAAAGLETAVDPLVAGQTGTRRRLVLSARMSGAGILLGFKAEGSNRIVAISVCPVATPALSSALETVRKIAAALAADSSTFRLTVTDTATGLDLAISGLKALSRRQRQHAIEITQDSGMIARLSVDGEILIETRKPTILMGDIAVELPPGAFVQASEAAEAAMADLVVDHFGKARKTADLFCGLGTFTLRLARTSSVRAVEADMPALDALKRAHRHMPGLKAVVTERRDLDRRPLMPPELDRFDAVVFDPPRAGAQRQSTMLAPSRVPLIAAISCYPKTLARDLAILVAGGYRIDRIVPIDQFVWTAHVETVALLRKG